MIWNLKKDICATSIIAIFSFISTNLYICHMADIENTHEGANQVDAGLVSFVSGSL